VDRSLAPTSTKGFPETRFSLARREARFLNEFPISTSSKYLGVQARDAMRRKPGFDPPMFETHAPRPSTGGVIVEFPGMILQNHHF
jgi:hypothetical protein